jgi:hypothetical protein
MNDRQAPIGTGRTTQRHSASIFAFSIAALAVLGMPFSQKTLTATLPDKVEISDMTWVEVRSAIEHGFTVAIVPSGGIEQNGPPYGARKARLHCQHGGHAHCPGARPHVGDAGGVLRA